MIYVTSDIHGCLDALKKMLKKIRFSDEDTLYIVGDAIDRGPESIQTLRYIMDASNIQLILGNHEEFLLEGLKSKEYGKTCFIDMSMWMHHGGKETYETFIRLSEKEQAEILEYLNSRPLYQILGDTVLVHGGILTNRKEYNSWETLMEQQKRETLLWIKDDFLLYPFEPKLEGRLIFGHTPTSEIQRIRGERRTRGKIWKDGQRWGIDGGYLYGGRLNCICLDNGKEYYV